MTAEERIAELGEEEPTSDPSDVYDDVTSLPQWWREVVYEFEENGLRPYQPSRFTDDEIVREVVSKLEQRYDVEIRLGAKNPEPDGPWAIHVDGEPVADVEHRREPDGYTRYGVSSDRFEEIVASAIESDDRGDRGSGSDSE
ncbi:hypothetical protein [Natrinema soli]|uniref:Uncharacterized protein n=1 Tax=Natrinema soli TaxID=1930624 RepID=A0ABD5SRW6_9EURY|nr:hypothetical protein [Natrinema soli]